MGTQRLPVLRKAALPPVPFCPISTLTGSISTSNSGCRFITSPRREITHQWWAAHDARLPVISPVVSGTFDERPRFRPPQRRAPTRTRTAQDERRPQIKFVRPAEPADTVTDKRVRPRPPSRALQPSLHEFRSAAVEFVGPPLDIGEHIDDPGQMLQRILTAAMPGWCRVRRVVHAIRRHGDRRAVRRSPAVPPRGGRSRWVPRSPARRSRTRRDSECGDSPLQRERLVSPLVDRRQQRHRSRRVAEHRSVLADVRRPVLGRLRPSQGPGDGRVLGFVTARSRIRSHRADRARPTQHRVGRPEPTVHSPAADRIVATQRR
jgi:hypothetical protein